MRPSIQAIFAPLLLILSTLTLSAQNSYSSIAEMKANAKSGENVTIDATFTIVGGNNYILIYDGASCILVSNGWYGNPALKPGNTFNGITGIYKTRENSSNIPNELIDISKYPASKILEEQGKLPKPEDITGTNITLPGTALYVQIKGVLGVYNKPGGEQYDLIRDGNTEYLIIYESEEPIVNKDEEFTVVGYVEYNVSYSDKYPWHIVVLDQWVGDRPADEIELEVCADPEEGGTVWIGNDEGLKKTTITAPGTENTIHAEPNDGWTFLKWILPNNEEKYENEIIVSPTASTKYIAYFQKNETPKYTLSVSASPEAGGDVSIIGTENKTYEFVGNSSVTVTATPAEGYDFDGWMEGSEIVSTELEYTFEIKGSTSLIAVFTEKPVKESWTIEEILAEKSPIGKEITLTGPYKVVCTSSNYLYISNGGSVLICTISSIKDSYPMGTVFRTITIVPNKDIDTGKMQADFKSAVETAESFSVKPESVDLRTIQEISDKYVEIRNVTLSNYGKGFPDMYYIKSADPEFYDVSFLLDNNDKLLTQNNLSSKTWVIQGVLAYSNMGGSASENKFVPCLIASSIVEQTGDEPELITLSVNVGQNEGGKVWIDDNKEQTTAQIASGSEHTISAEPLEGWEFVRWTCGDDVVGSESTITVNPLVPSTYTAHFSRKQISVNVLADPSEGGKVWIDDNKEQTTAQIASGSEHTISAEPSEGWEFVRWTCGDDVIGSESTITVNPLVPSTYTAHFSRKQISVNVVADPSEGGEVWIDNNKEQTTAQIASGSVHTISAEPSEGWEFVRWTCGDDVIGSESTIAVNPLVSSTYTAHFSHKPVSVNVVANPSDGGKVWIDNEDTQAITIKYGTEHTLYAESQDGWEFINWTLSGDEIGTDKVQKVIIDADGEYVANFKELAKLEKYTVEVIVEPVNGGSVTINDHTDLSLELDEGAEVSLNAHAAEEYEFLEWRKGGKVISTEESYRFRLTENTAITAVFNLKAIKEEVSIRDILDGNAVVEEEVSLTGPFKVICVEPDAIYISDGANVIKCTGGDFSGVKYPVGTVLESVSLVPHIADGSNESYATLKDIVPTTEKNVEVEPIPFDLNTISEAFGKYVEIKDINLEKHPILENGYIMTSSEPGFEGKSFILRANQLQGDEEISAAEKWTIHGVITYCEIPVSRSNDITQILVASDLIKQTQPAPEKVTLSVCAIPEEAGTVWIDDNETLLTTYIDAGSSHTIHARASEGWIFVNWKIQGILVGSEADIAVTPGHSSTYEAFFERKPLPEKYTVTIAADPEEGGTVAITGTEGTTGEFEEGTQVSVAATPTEGYDFSGWSDGTKIVSTSQTYTFNIDADVTLTAIFTQQPIVKEITLKDILDGTAPLGEEVTLTGPFKVICVEFATIYISNGTDVLKCYGLNNAEIDYPEGTILESVTVVPKKEDGSNENYSALKSAVKSDSSALDVEPVEFTLKNINEAFGKYVEIRNISLRRHSWMQDAYVMYCTEPGYSGLTHLLYTTDFSGTEEIPYSKKWTIRGVITYYNTGNDPSENVFEPILIASYIKEQAGSEPEKYNITLSASPANSGKVWIGDNQEAAMKSFDAGSQVTIHALPAEGMLFKEWQQASKVIATTPDYTFTVNDNISLVAIFATAPPVKRIIKFSSADDSKGTVIVEGYTGVSQVEVSGPVTLRAVPASSEHTFSHWTKNGERIQGNAELTYSDPEDAEFVAYFTSSYAVTFTSPVNGTINVTSSDGAPIRSGTKVAENTVIIIQLVPADGYRVNSISANGVEISHTADAVEYVVTSSVVISGKVEAKAAGTHVVSVISSNTELGTAYVGSPGITSVSLTYPDVAELHAEPAFGCKFEGWRLVNTTNFISTNPVYTVDTPIHDAHFEAVFNYIIQTPRTITVVPSNPKKGTVKIKGESGTTVTTQKYLTLIAAPLTENDEFVDWTDESNTVLSTSPEFVYDKEPGGTITANFKSRYLVKYSAEGPGSLSLLADGSQVLSGPATEASVVLPENTRLSLKLVPGEHHEVGAIVINGKDVAQEYIDEEGTYNMVLTETVDIKVTFVPVHYKITINDSPHGTVAIFREIDSNGQGVGSSLVDQDRVQYASSIYIFVKPIGDYRLESVRINGELRQPEQDKEYLLHKVEGDVAIEPVFAAVTGIDAILSPDMEDEIEMVYDLSGRLLGNKLPARKGIYLVKIGKRVYKIKI